MDLKNQYFAYFETFAKIEAIHTNRNDVIVIGGMNQG